VPCETLNIIESKSFKLYLNSFNNTRFADADEVRERIARKDINEACGAAAGAGSRWACGCCCPSCSTASRCTNSTA
jgi:hypothetical protein